MQCSTGFPLVEQTFYFCCCIFISFMNIKNTVVFYIRFHKSSRLVNIGIKSKIMLFLQNFDLSTVLSKAKSVQVPHKQLCGRRFVCGGRVPSCPWPEAPLWPLCVVSQVHGNIVTSRQVLSVDRKCSMLFTLEYLTED